MTLVNLTAEETVLGGFAAVASGVVTATYWAGQAAYTNVTGADVRFPAKITVQIRDGVPADPVEMVPTRGACCVRWKISDVRSGMSLSRYTEIPDVESVDFGDLPVVDPASFAPVTPSPSLVETINAQVAAYMAEHPGVSPADVAAAVEAWLAEHPLEGVTQDQLDAAIADIELTPGPPGPSAVSADAGNLLKLGSDRLPMLDPADVPSGGGDGGLSGTGSPEGSRAAPVGTIYTDTAATTGAIRWIKASGTGATGWKVLYGDTGPRSLSLPDGLSNGLITIHRCADEITIRLQSINNSAAGATVILALPLGWRPLTAPTGVAMVAGNAPTGALMVASGWDLVFNAGAGNFRHAILKYQTPDPWPTILPGTAA